MRHWLNIGHVQFNMFYDRTTGTYAAQIIGKLVHCDETGCTILKESDGTYHSYADGVVEHATPAV